MENMLLDVKCYKCGREMRVHPAVNANAPFLTDCELHKESSTDD